VSTLLAAADHWDSEAKDASAKAAYDRRRGFTGLYHPGDYNADLYARAAKSLRLQEETGQPHCICHLIPSDGCKFSSEKKI
jgi:hypothetical protein